MRRVTAFVFVFFWAALCGAQTPIPDTMHGVEKLNALVQRVSQMQATTKTLQASFEQRRNSRLLAAPSISRGRFYYQAPDEVRWDYESPRQMTVLIAKGVATTYRPAEKRAERIELARVQRRVFRFLGAAEPLERLKRYFSFTLRDRGAGSNYVLELDPVTHQIKKRLKDVVLEIDRTTFMPVAVSYSEPDGDSTAYAFSGIERNQPLPAGLFTLDIPPDVKVVEMKLHGAGD